MGVNKVVFGAVSIIDISDSTVTTETLGKGATAYDKSGEKIVGTMEAEDLSSELAEYTNLNAELESVINSLPESAETEDLTAELAEYENLNAELEDAINSLFGGNNTNV